VVAYETAFAYYDLFRRFQRVRWHAAYNCLHGNSEPITDARWHAWLGTPIPDSNASIASQSLFKTSRSFGQAAKGADMSSCFTCGECSSSCPVAVERSAFDPRFIFRMVNLGLADELLLSPSIWLCVQCGRCTDACSQLVDGCRMIAGLRELAVQEGKVDEGFPLRVRDAQKQIYMRLIDEIDKLLGMQLGRKYPPTCPIPVAECA
jgi:ferredoxin